MLRRVLIVTVALTATFGLNPQFALATIYTDNMVGTLTNPALCQKGSLGSAEPCQTDNATLTFWYTHSGSLALASGDVSNLRYVLNNEYDALTDLTVNEQSTPTLTGSTETDIIFQRGDVPGTDVGYTWCDDPTSGYQCDQQYVQIEAGFYYDGLICHETGHAVGLTHGDEAYPVLPNNDSRLDCMVKSPSTTQPLGTNSISNIHGTY